MDTIFMNSENSRTPEPHILKLKRMVINMIHEYYTFLFQINLLIVC